MGEHDRLCPRDRHDLMHALMPQSRLVVVRAPGTCRRWKPLMQQPRALRGWLEDDMNTDLLDLLRKVDTPTVCNAIEVVQGRRGFAASPAARWSAPNRAAPWWAMPPPRKSPPLRPATESADVIRARRMAYYRAMHDAPKPSVAVVEDLDYPTCIGAYWGEINTTVHKGFGMAGALTNGVVRDLGDLPRAFR
jgi:hypothetical protein